MDAYFEQKPKDILIPDNVDRVDNDNPFPVLEEVPGDASRVSSIDPKARCPVFEEKGECGHGFKCRFLGAHVKKLDDGTLELVRNEEIVALRKIETTERNYLPSDALRLIRSKKVGAEEPSHHYSANLLFTVPAPDHRCIHEGVAGERRNDKTR